MEGHPSSFMEAVLGLDKGGGEDNAEFGVIKKFFFHGMLDIFGSVTSL